MTTTWLPSDWAHPSRVELPTGHHLRPIHPDDTELDLPAVTGSRERLWSIYGEAWGWPPPEMSAEQDREDLQHHWDEMQTHESFNYALFDAEETDWSAASTSIPPTSPARTPTSPGGSATSASGAPSRRRSTTWCLPGSPPTGRSRGPGTSAGTSAGPTGPRSRARADAGRPAG